ncbi:MAG: thiol:disulfide interchange protein DsbA [Paraglaciecola sp.]|jgi:thiol:disulfide interchange protein DsbA
MKKIVLSLFIILLLPLQACAQEKWQEGEHYVVVSDEATAQPEVVEFFSFWCPHCFNFEPLVAQIKKQIDTETTFKKVHVNFMGFTGPDVQNDATRAMLVARSLKKEDALNEAVFRYIHVQGSSVSGLKDLKNIFIVNGIEPETFDKMVTSFGVSNMLKMNNKTIEQYRKHLNGVPNFIVNGKFQAKFTREMKSDDMIELIVWLTKQK